MSDPMWKKKLFSGRYLATVSACVVFSTLSIMQVIPYEEVVKIVLVVFTFYFSVDRNGHGTKTSNG